MLRRLLLLLFPAFVIFWNLGYAPFWNPDEGRYAAASYEMAYGLGPTQPNWLIPHLNTVTRLNKPPLVYWTTGAAFKTFGTSEWSGRLPSALAALVVMVLIYVWGSRAWSARAGLGAALVWATGAFPASMGRTCNTDMLLTASMTLGVFGLFWLIEAVSLPEAARKSARLWSLLLAGLGMGLSLLSKGPVGVAFPIAIVGLYVIFTNRWKFVPWGACFASLGIGLLIGLPWYFAVEVQRPGFIQHFVFAENLSRFSGAEQYHKKTSPLFYLPILIVGLFPWTAFLIPTFGAWREETDLAKRSRLFLIVWTAFIVLFFSASGTKLLSYVLPAFPALALLMGSTIARWEKISPRLRGATVALSVFISLGILIALLAYPKKDKVTKQWKVNPGILRDGRVLKQQDGALWTQTLCALVAIGVVLLIIASRRPNGKTMLLAQGGYSAFAVAILIQMAGHICYYEDGSGAVTAIVPILRPDDEVVGYKSFLPTSMFYTRRPTTFVPFLNTSGLDEKEIEVSPYFILRDQPFSMKEWLAKRKHRVFIIIDGEMDADLKPQLFYWGRTTDFALYSNRPKDENFVLDTFAPLKSLTESQPVPPGKAPA